MKNIGLGALALLVISLAGCGGGSNPTSSSTNSAARLAAGNWNLTATSTVVSNTSYIGGSLASSGGKVTGVFHISHSSCFDLLADLPVTGTINSSNHVSITSAALNGQVITALLEVPAGISTMTGTYAIKGGCADGDVGNINGNIVPDISGSWSGRLLSFSNDSVQQVNVHLAQSQTANSDGFYVLSGTVDFPISKCFTSGTIQNSLSAGGAFIITIATNNGTVNASGTLTDMAIGKNMSISYSISGGSCGGNDGVGIITRL